MPIGPPRNMASQALVLVLVVAGLFVIIRFEMFVLAALAHRPDDELRFLPRAGWLAVCLLTIPFGGVLYLTRGRGRSCGCEERKG